MDKTRLSPAEVRAHRKSLRLTQPQLADRFGIAVRTLKYWEDETAPEQRRIPRSDALLLRYMVKFGLPETALKGRK